MIKKRIRNNEQKIKVNKIVNTGNKIRKGKKETWELVNGKLMRCIKYHAKNGVIVQLYIHK